MPSAHWEGHGVTLYLIVPQVQTWLKYLLLGEVFTTLQSWWTGPHVHSLASGLLARDWIVYVLFPFPSLDCPQLTVKKHTNAYHAVPC